MRAAVRWSGLVDEGSDDDYVLGNSEKKEKLKREKETSTSYPYCFVIENSRFLQKRVEAATKDHQTRTLKLYG